MAGIISIYFLEQSKLKNQLSYISPLQARRQDTEDDSRTLQLPSLLTNTHFHRWPTTLHMWNWGAVMVKTAETSEWNVNLGFHWIGSRTVPVGQLRTHSSQDVLSAELHNGTRNGFNLGLFTGRNCQQLSEKMQTQYLKNQPDICMLEKHLQLVKPP